MIEMNEMYVLGYHYFEGMKSLSPDEREGQEVGKVLLSVDGELTLNTIWGTCDNSDYFVWGTGDEDEDGEEITETESMSDFMDDEMKMVSQADIAKATHHMEIYLKASRDELSSFEDYLWKAISKADNVNLKKFVHGFPAHVYAWKVYVSGAMQATLFMSLNGYLIEGVSL